MSAAGAAAFYPDQVRLKYHKALSFVFSLRVIE